MQWMAMAPELPHKEGQTARGPHSSPLAPGTYLKELMLAGKLFSKIQYCEGVNQS